MRRPSGVTAIALSFLLNGAFLCSSSILLPWFHAFQGRVHPRWLAHWLGQLSFVHSYLTFIMGIGWAIIGAGLLWLHNWARLAAMVLIFMGAGMMAGRFFLSPGHLQTWTLFSLEFALRCLVVWYLFRSSTADYFLQTQQRPAAGSNA